MPRRAGAEFRRLGRRGLLGWIWWLLGFFAVAGLVLFFVHHYSLDRFGPQTEKVAIIDDVRQQNLNFTRELLSSTSFARQLANQMTLAKAYVIIAKEHSNLQLAWKLGSQIINCQRLLSQAAVRAKPITLEEADPVITQLSKLIYSAQDSHYDIGTTIITLKNHAQALEERANAATAQTTEFGQIAAGSISKSLHCLNIRLTEEWFRNPAAKRLPEGRSYSHQLVDNSLYHFCIFSDNVLATSVVVNSTTSNANYPQRFVFHVVTDSINYRAMTTWFLRNDFKGCTVDVQNIEELSWYNSSYSPLVKQLLDSETRAHYFDGGSPEGNAELKFRNAKSVSLLNHLRFYIPEVYPALEKVVFLDDDVVVQKDLTALFSLDLHGNVNGAVETCLEAFHRFYKYVNFTDPLISAKFDPQACGWAFGMNVFDLIEWKKADVTARYHYWQEQNANHTLWNTGTVPPGLLTFYGLVEPLNRRWHVLGLGYDLDIDDRLIESAAVVHFNGNMKPWLKLSIGKYKQLWQRYVDLANPYLHECIMY